MKTHKTARAECRSVAQRYASAAPRLRPLAGHIRAALLPGILFSLHAGGVQAGPEGGQIVAGQGAIARPNAATTLITQRSPQLALDWQSFNVKSNELVQFAQPGPQAEALNRIFDQRPSEILGRIQANGRVLLMNPNGVFFGPGAQVNVNGLVAAGMNIKVEDFMAGRYKLEAQDGATGAVVNQGVIAAATGGDVTLVGKSVRNEGVIVASAGRVNLAAGDKVTLDFDGDGLMRFAIDDAVLDNAPGVTDAVKNSGSIAADGGTVIIGAHAAKDVFTNAVNNTGVIRAGRIDNSGGVVRLVGAGPGASVLNTGTLDASAATVTGDGGRVEIAAATIDNRGRIAVDAVAGSGGSVALVGTAQTVVTGGGAITAASVSGKGGEVHLLGEKVGLFDRAQVDVSGGRGGGTALIGGDYQGANAAIRNAEQTVIADEASIAADATADGDGGRVIVWADGTTRFHGAISATGGPAAGDGGFAEVSGKNSLIKTGRVDLTAAQGKVGTLLLDPLNIQITGGTGDGSDNPDASGSALEHATGIEGNAAGAGSNTAGTIAFTDEGAGVPDPFIVREKEIEDQSATANIILRARNAITTSGTFDHIVGGEGNGVVLLAAGASLTLETENDAGDGSGGIDLTGSTHGSALEFRTQGTGGINLQTGISGADAGSANIVLSSLRAAGTGTIKVEAEGSITDGATASITSGGGSVELIAGAGIGTSSGSPLDTAGVTTLAATTATGGIFLSNGGVSDITVQTVGGTTGLSTTTSGAVELTNTAGSIAVNQAIAAAGGGRIVLAASSGLTSAVAGTLTAANATAGGDAGDIDLDVTSAGNINLQGTITAGSADNGGGAAGSGGDVSIDAADGTIAAAAITTSVGNGAAAGGTAGTVTITGTDVGNNATHDVTLNGAIAAGGGSNGTAGIVSITADNSILDGNGATANITAASATLTVTGAAGVIDTTNTLETAVATLTASAAGGLSIANTGDLTATLTASNGTATLSVASTLTTGNPWSANGFNIDADGAITIDHSIVSDTATGVDIASSGDAITLSATGSINSATGAGPITLTADDLLIDAAATLNAGTGAVAFVPNAGRTVGVGAAVAQQFDLTDAEIDRVTAGSLSIGATDSGDLLIGAVAPTDGDINLVLRSGGTIDEETDDAASKVTTTGTLTLEAAAAIGDNADANAFLDLSVGGLSATTAGGGIFLRESAGLAIVNTGGVNGVRTTGGNAPIELRVASGDLGLSAAVEAHGTGNITVTVTDGNIVDTLADLLVDFQTGGTLALDADSIGAPGFGNIDIDVATLTAVANGAAGTGIFLFELDSVTADGLTIGGTGVQTTANDAQIGLALGAGNLTLNEDITAHGAGNILIVLGGAGATLTTDNAADDIASTSGGITIIADSMSLSLGEITTTGTLQLRPQTATRAINLGSGAGGLDLTDGELDLVTTALLILGDLAHTGAINLTSDIDTANTASASLRTTGAIDSDAAANVFTEGTIDLQGGTIGIVSNTFGVDAATITANAASGNLNITNGATAADIELDASGTVNFQSSAAITSAGDMTAQSFALATTAGDVTIEHNMTSTGGAGAISLTTTAAAGAINLDPTGAADITIQTNNANTITLASEAVPFIDRETVTDTGVANIVTNGGQLVIDTDSNADGDTLALGDDAAASDDTFSDALLQSLADANGGTVTIGNAAAGDVSLDLAASFGVRSLGIVTGGVIDDADTGTALQTTGTLTLTTASTVGATSVGGLNLDVANLALTTGAATVTNAGALTLLNSILTGALDVTTTAGTLTLNTVTATGQLVTLDAAGAIADGNAAANNVTAAALNATAASGIDLDTAAGTITAGVSGPGSIDIDEADAVVLSSVTTANGGITVDAGGALTAATVTAGGAGANASLTTTSGNIITGSVGATAQVILNAAGTITDNNAATTNITATSLAATAATGIDLDTAVGTLSANVTDAGGIDLSDTDAVTLSSVTTADGAITVAAGGTLTATAVDAQDANADESHDVSLATTAGDIVAGAISADDQVTLNAAAAITDGNGIVNNISAQVLTATAASGIDLDTGVGSLSANVAGAGAIDIDEANTVTLTNVATADGAITVAAGGAMTVVLVDAQDAGNDANHNVTLATSAGNIAVTALTADNQAALTAAAAITDGNGAANNISALSLNATAASGIDLDTTVAAITANVTGAGAVDLDEADAVTLISVTTADGAIAVDAGGAMTATLVTASDAGNDASHDVVLTTAAGNLAAGAITADNQATLTAGAAITDGNAAATNVTAVALNAAAASGIDLDTDVATITANVTAAGTIDFDEANAVTLTSVQTADGAIAVAAGGTVTVTAVAANDAGNDAAHDVILTATAGNLTLANNAVAADDDAILSADTGSITAAGGSAHVTAGHDIDLSAQTNLGDITSFAAGTGTPLQIIFGNQLVSATITAAGGEINLDVGNSLATGGTLAANAIVVDVDGNAQAILQSAGNLNFSATANAFVAAAGDSVGVISGGILTIPGAGLSLAGVNLLLSGAIDVVDDGVGGDGNARTLALTAQDLGFVSGAAGGATTLATTVANLTADINGVGSLTLNETDGIALVSIAVQNGGFTAIAGGAVTVTNVAIETDADANDVAITATAGAIEVGTISTAGGAAADVALTANTVAGQSIVDTDGNSSIEADQLLLTAANGAGAVGSVANAIRTTVNTVSAAGGSGGVIVTETNGASFTATAQGAGTVRLRSISGTLTIGGATNTGTGTIDIASTDGVAVNAALGDATDGSITIAANTDGAGADALSQAAGGTIQTGDSSANAVRILVNSATGTGGATLGANITTGAGGTITITTANGGAAGTAITRIGGTLSAGTVALTTGNGNIGALGAEIATAADTLNATATNGSLFISETDALTVNNVLATGTGTNDVTIAAGGDLSIGLAQADNTVTLASAAGQILEAGADSAADVVAPAIDLNAATGILGLELNGTTLSADTTSGNVIFDNLATTVTALNSLSGGNAILTFVDGLTLGNAANVINLPGGAVNLTVDSGDNRSVQLDLGGGTFTFGTLNLTGGTDGNDTLVGQNNVNRWQINGANTGTLENVTAGYTASFDAFGSLRGAANQADTFTFANGASLSGVVQGGLAAAVDILDWTAFATARTVVLNGAGAVDGFAGQEASLNGGGANGFVNIDTLVVGQNLLHSITGLNTVSTWTLIAGGRTYLDTVSGRTLDLAALGPGANGTGFRDLNGGTGNDTFQIGQAATPVAVTANLAGGDGDDTFNLVGAGGGSVLTGTITGGIGNDTVNFGPPTGAPPTAEDGEDSRIVGSVDLGAGVSDTIDFSGSDAFQTFLVTSSDANGNIGTLLGFGPDTGLIDLISDGFAGIDVQIGNTKGPLVGQNNANTWIITGINSGTLDGTPFVNFQLIGGTATDVFEFRSGGRIDFGISGGAGAGQNTVRGDSIGAFAGLIILDGARSGTIDANTADAVLATTFIEIDLAQGGIGSDVFAFQASGTTFAGRIDGRAGDDTLDLGTLTGPRTITLTAAGAIDGYDGNDVALNTGSAFATGFINIDVLAGSGDGDTLVAPSVDLNAGNATDNFFFVNDLNAGALSTADGHDATPAARLRFSGFADLTGGAADDEFEFDSDGVSHGRIDGIVDGGLGQDRLDFAPLDGFVDPLVQITGPDTGPSDGFAGLTIAGTTGANDPVTVIAGGFRHMNAVTGGTGDLISPSNQPTTFTITGVDAFTIDTSTINFLGFSGIVGGAADDTFIFNLGGQMSAGIDGGGGTGNRIVGSVNADRVRLTAVNTGAITVDVAGAALVSAIAAVQIYDGAGQGAGTRDRLDLSALPGALTVNLATGAATGTSGISNFEAFTGNAAPALNAFGGPNDANTWVINADDAAVIDNTFAFTGFGNLIGGSAADIFDIANGISLSGAVNGGAGIDVLDYANDTRNTLLDLSTGVATGIFGGAAGGINALESFVGGSGANALTSGNGDDIWIVNAPNNGTLNGAAFTGFRTLGGAAGNDSFTLSVNAAGAIAALSGGLGNDTLSQTFNSAWVVNAQNQGGTGVVTAFTDIESLTAAGGANATLDLQNGTVTGNFTAGTVTLTDGTNNANGGPLLVVGNLVSNDAQTITVGPGGFSVSGNLTSNNSFTVNSAGGNFQVNGSYTSTGATSVTTGAGAILIGGAVNNNAAAFSAVANTTGATTAVIGGPIAAGAVTLASAGTSVGTVTTGSGAQNYNGATTLAGNLTGGDLNFSGAVDIAGEVRLESSTNIFNFNAAAVSGTGALVINPTSGTDLVINTAGVALGQIAANAFTGHEGHLIIGGALDPTTSPAEDAAVVEVNANRITIAEDFSTAGDITFLASNIDLLANLSAGGPGGGQVTMLALGDTQGAGEPEGDITGPTAGTVEIAAGKAVLIANNAIVNDENIRLELDGGTLLVAVGSGQEEPTFDPTSNAVSDDFEPESLRIISSLTNPIGVQAVQVVFSNPAAALTGLQNVQFIDVGLFEEELTLFGVIGNGVAMSLDQCEEPEGCAPNVTPEDLARLIETLEARIAELEKRQAAGQIGEAEATRLLAGYRAELANFRTYQQQLQEYQEAEEEVSDDFEEFDEADFDEDLEEAEPATPAEAAPAEAAPAPAEPAVPAEDFEQLEEAVEPPAGPAIPPAAPAEESFEELEEGFEPAPAPAQPPAAPAPALPEELPDEFEELEEELDDALILGLVEPADVNQYRGAVRRNRSGRVTWTGDLALPAPARRY